MARKGSDITRTDRYKAAGVDISAGARFVEMIKPLAKSTDRPGTMAEIGSFGALFDPKAAGFADPVLVATTDGVGTKVKLAAAMDDHTGIGIDLVAMCVNDLIVQGATPLFFLDYLVTAKLEPERAAEAVAGIAAGCRDAGCALIGGETAEHPGHFAAGEYDLAGFAVGAVERTEVLTGADIAPGDAILGLASSGVHSNGFSLVRKIIADGAYELDAPAPFDRERTLGAALLTPTRIYVQSILEVLKTGRIKGLAHITGGGLSENIPRVLPAECDVRLDATAWPRPPVFSWLQEAGDISEAEMARTFNCGIGMAVITAEGDREAVADAFRKAGETVYHIGAVVARND